MLKKNLLKKQASLNKKLNKIISIFIVFFLITTIGASVIASANNKDKPIKAKLDNFKEKTDNFVKKLSNNKISQSLADVSNEEKDYNFLNPLSLVSSSDSSSTFTLFTSYNGVEKTSNLKFFKSTKVDVDGNGDDDIDAKLSLLPGIERPFCLSINFGLKITRLSGFDDVNSEFSVFAEFNRPGLLDKSSAGDKVRWGYNSPQGDKVPSSCTITYKFVPHLILFGKKPEHKFQINPGSDSIDKLGVLIGYINTNDGSSTVIKTVYEPAVESKISFKRLGGVAVEFETERIGSSTATMYIARTKKGNTTTAYIKDLPGHVSISMDIGKTGYVEFNTYDEPAGEIGVCDDFDNPVNKIYFTDLFSLGRIEWGRDRLFWLRKGKAYLNVYTEGNNGVDVNAHLVEASGGIFDLAIISDSNIDCSAELDLSEGKFSLKRSNKKLDVEISINGANGTTLDWSFTLESVNDEPFEVTFKKLLNEKIDFSFSGKEITITDFYLYLGLSDKSIGIKADTIVFEQDGSVNCILIIRQEEDLLNFNFTFQIIRGIKIYGFSVGYFDIWSNPRDIIVEGSRTIRFDITIEDIDIKYKFGEGWGWILIRGSVTFSSYRLFTHNGIEGGVIGTVTIGAGSNGLNISWYTVNENGNDVKKFNINGLNIGLEDFHLYYGDKIDLSIPDLQGSIEVIDACSESGELVFEAQGGGGSLDVDIVVDFDEFSDFQVDLNIDDLDIDLFDSSATIILSWADGNISNIRFFALADIKLTIVDFDLELSINGSKALIIENMDGYIDGYAGIDVDLSIPLDIKVDENGKSIDLSEDTFAFVFEDIEAYIHIDVLNISMAGMDLGEVEFHVDVDGELSISIIGVSVYNYPDWSFPEDDTYWNWAQVTLGIDANDCVFSIVSVKIENFNKIIELLGFPVPVQLTLDLDNMVIDGYSEFSVRMGGFNDTPVGMPNLLAIGVRFDNTPGTTIDIDKVAVYVPDLVFIDDAPLTGLLKNTLLEAGVLDFYLTLWGRHYSFKVSDGSAISHMEFGAEIPDYGNVTVEIDQSIDYLHIEYNDEFNDEPEPYNSWFLIDTLNETIAADVYMLVSPELIFAGVDYINDNFGLSLPYPDIDDDQGIRFNGITLQADEFKVFLNQSATNLFAGYLHVFGDGKIWWLVDGVWEPLFGDLGFSIEVIPPNHIKIQFLADCTDEVIDFYSEDLDITIKGTFTSDAGVVVDIYLDTINSGNVEIEVTGDVEIKDFDLSYGEDLGVSGDRIYLDIDGTTANIDFDLNNVQGTTIEANANINSLNLENVRFYADLNGVLQTDIVVSGSLDLSMSGTIYIKTDLAFSSLEIDANIAGSLSVTNLDVNVFSGQFILTCIELTIEGSGSISFSDDIVVSATINTIDIDNLYVSFSSSSLSISGHLDVSAAASVYLKTDLSFTGLQLSISGGGTVTVTGLNVNVNSGFLIVSCNSLSITGGGYLNIGQTIKASIDLTSVDINNLNIRGSGIALGPVIVSLDVTLSLNGELHISANVPVTYVEIEAAGSGSIQGDISVKYDNIIEVNIQDIDINAEKIRLGASSSSRYVEIDTFGTSTSIKWNWGEIKLIQQGLTFGYDGLSTEAQFKGDLRFEWTGAISQLKPTSLKLKSNNGFNVYVTPLKITINNNEITTIGVGLQLDGILDFEEINWDSQNKPDYVHVICTDFTIGGTLDILGVFSFNGGLNFNGEITFDKADNYVMLEGQGSHDVDLEIDIPYYQRIKSQTTSFDGYITVDWTYGLSVYANINSFSHVSNIEVQKASEEKIVVSNWDLQPGTIHINYWDIEGTDAYQFSFDGDINFDLYKHTDISTGEEKIKLVNLDVNGDFAFHDLGAYNLYTGRYYLESSSGIVISSSAVSINIFDFEFSAGFELQGDLTVEFGEHDLGGDILKMVELTSDNGIDSNIYFNLNNFELELSVDCNSGYLDTMWELNGDFDGMISSDSSALTGSASVKVLYNNYGVDLTFSGSYDANNFLVQWDPVLFGLLPGNWQVTGNINTGEGSTIDFTESVSSGEWYNVYPVCIEPNQAPVCIFDWSPTNPNTGETITFDATDSYDPDSGGVVSYIRWDWDEGSGWTSWHMFNNNWKTKDHIYNSPGDYNVRCQVADLRGKTSNIETHTVSVGGSGGSISISLFGYNGDEINEGEKFRVHVEDEQTGDPIPGTIEVKYYNRQNSGSWQFIEVRSLITDYDTGYFTAEDILYSGSPNSRILVTTSDSGYNDENHYFDIEPSDPANQDPIAVLDKTDYYGNVGETVFFDGTGSYDPDGFIDWYRWESQDGGSGKAWAGPEVDTLSYAWNNPGEYTMKLIVTDDEGATDEVTANVHINAKPEVYIYAWRLNWLGVWIFIGGSNNYDVIIDSEGQWAFTAYAPSSHPLYPDSNDPDGTMEQYRWEPSFLDSGWQPTNNGNIPPTDSIWGMISLGTGTHDIKLSVEDDDGAITSETLNLMLS